MGLSANIPAIESAQALAFARGIAIAFGDSRALAEAVHSVTGSDRLAQSVEVKAQMQRGLNG